MLKLSIVVLILATVFNGVHMQLTCLCTGATCATGGVVDCPTGEICMSAEIREDNGNIKIVRDCLPEGDCSDIFSCPTSSRTDTCAKFGCCNTNRCVVNYTLGEDLEVSSSTPVPVPVPVPTSSKISMAASPALVPTPKPSSSVVAMTTKAPVAAALTTSSSPAKMTSGPVMQASESKMSEVVQMMTSSAEPMMTSSVMEPMMSSSAVELMMSSSAVKPVVASEMKTSAQPEVKPSKAMMTSSSEEHVKPSPSINSGMFNSLVLVTEDPRPPCDAAAVRMLNLYAVLLTAIILLCRLF